MHDDLVLEKVTRSSRNFPTFRLVLDEKDY